VNMKSSPGSKFRKAVNSEKPLQIVGTVNAYIAILAKHSGFKAIYLSGAGVANSSYGLPDLGITTLDDVLEDARRITAAVDLPLLVDIDTGWGNAFLIERTIKSMIRLGVAAIHIEDQISQKRCGHLSGKVIVSKEEMVDRIKAAVDARIDPDFVIMARTDAFAVEGIELAIERAIAYRDAGADMLFPEALHSLEDYQKFKKAVEIPILANLTEFGKTPLFLLSELASANIDMALYPLSANRAMNLAALKVFEEIRGHGTQIHILENMQTREELYGFLNYRNY
jgi:methylisocitrate lyase